MRQVPADPHFLLVGDGRLARHLAHYLTLLGLPFDQWSRRQGPPSALRDYADRASHVLLAISDSALAAFVEDHPDLHNCFHFSGALTIAGATSVHPLMTFSHELYPLDVYKSIPFICEAESLPGFPNRSFALDPAMKPLYHALCVMSGNFTVLLWEKAFASFASLGLPREVLLPYLAQVATNLITAAPGESVLTGPLARGDSTTIDKNLAALGGDPYADVYRAFVRAFTTCKDERPLGGFV